MTKKKVVGENGDAERIGLQPVLLLAGTWQEELGEAVCKLLIASALNDCVKDNRLLIRGYWITRGHVCLVLWLSPAELRPMLTVIYKRLQAGITRYIHGEEVKGEHYMIHLFKQKWLVDEDLIGLLTGLNINKPYYDPQLEQLKHTLHRADFCSVIDYSGAVGPVIVDINKNVNIS